MKLPEARVFVIAEGGVNHNGSTEIGLALIDAARAAGADAIKFQTFRADRLVTGRAPLAAYQRAGASLARDQRDMLTRLELSEEQHERFREHCEEVGIELLSTPFDEISLRYLVGLGVPRIKVASGEITNGPLLLQAGRTGKPVILSTGMATLGEVEEALAVIAFGRLEARSWPTPERLRAVQASAAARAALADGVTLLHCTTAYPAPWRSVNLRAMDTLRSAFGLPVGYSDHTTGIAVAVAAVARGAVIVEKHVTLDKQMPGPDHAASISPAELAELVNAVRAVEEALGSENKTPQAAELENTAVVRKCLVAARSITAGELLSEENVVAKRPARGLSPMAMWRLIGRPARRSYQLDEPLEE
ncbi:MAG: N-acetylneuraminate synthase [Candidatus Schekmanbacteria bacterium]|nr:N-acetylneuraminate synthase [Candidatus Schekmanbacteria bacterium]